MTNANTVATGNANQMTKTTCRECGFTIRSENAKMVACPECRLIQWAGPSCLNRRGERTCVLAGSHSGSCDFSGTLQCKTHKDHAYTRHSCGHQFCDRYWKSCPRCFGRDNFEANLKEGA